MELEVTFDRVIENVVLTETLLLEGANWNNTLIRNLIIEDVDGTGIILRDVSNIRIENVTIRNVTGDGIKFSTDGSTSDVVITDSHIHNIGQDGVNSGQRAANGVDHPGLQIIGNTIENVSLSGDGQGLLHGIYMQSTDFVIQGNLIRGVSDGNGISARSSGEISGNYIESTQQSGIAYFSDNNKGASDRLLISNNVIVDAGLDGERSDISLLEIPAEWANEVLSLIEIENNTLTSGQAEAVFVSQDYDNTTSVITQSGNETVARADAVAQLGVQDFGGDGSDPTVQAPASLTPGDVLPDLFGDQNIRITFGDSGWGQSDILITAGGLGSAEYKLAPGFALPFADAPQTGLSFFGYAGTQQVNLGFDSGAMAVLSNGEDVPFAGDSTMSVSGNETLIAEMDYSVLERVTHVSIGLQDVDVGETLSIELWSNGAFIMQVDRAMSEIMRFDSAVAFDEVRLASGANSDFSVTWFEFGATEGAQDIVTPSLKTFGLTLSTANNSDTLADFLVDDATINTLNVASATTFKEVSITELDLKIQAGSGNVVVEDGGFGIARSGEAGAQTISISGDDTLVFSLKPDAALGDATSATLQFLDLLADETVAVEAYHNGLSLGTTLLSGSPEFSFETSGVFDTLAISAQGDSEFRLQGIEFACLSDANWL